MLWAWILAALCGIYNLFLAISRGNGINFLTAVVWLIAAFIWFNRWRGTRKNEDG